MMEWQSAVLLEDYKINDAAKTPRVLGQTMRLASQSWSWEILGSETLNIGQVPWAHSHFLFKVNYNFP